MHHEEYPRSGQTDRVEMEHVDSYRHRNGPGLSCIYRWLSLQGERPRRHSVLAAQDQGRRGRLRRRLGAEVREARRPFGILVRREKGFDLGIAGASRCHGASRCPFFSKISDSGLSLFVAEVNGNRLSAFSHRPHLAGLRIGLDNKVSHRIVAEPLGPSIRPRHDEEPIPLVMLEFEMPAYPVQRGICTTSSPIRPHTSQ
jgi:hypothetical protein